MFFLNHIDWHWLWLIVASFLAGTLNAVAGGGSFLSFPAMMGMGIGPIQANASNTVALWPGQLTSIAAYRDDFRKNIRMVLPMGLAGLLGGTAGRRGSDEDAAVDLSSPGSLAAGHCSLHFCRQRPGFPLAPTQQELDCRRHPRAAPPADLFRYRFCVAFTSDTSAPGRAFC